MTLTLSKPVEKLSDCVGRRLESFVIDYDNVVLVFEDRAAIFGSEGSPIYEKADEQRVVSENSRSFVKAGLLEEADVRREEEEQRSAFKLAQEGRERREYERLKKKFEGGE